MKVLVACEESQRVCKAFRERGHEAYSCDIIECSGGHPEWHIMDDVLVYLDGRQGGLFIGEFQTQDGEWHEIPLKWDMIIAFPPCTYLSCAATRSHSLKGNTLEGINKRTLKRIDAMQFFILIANANCDHIAIENPNGVMNTAYRKPDQSIEPYYFASGVDDVENYYTKHTNLWLKGLPVLKFECHLPNPMDNAERWGNGKKKCWTESNHGGYLRSKTPPQICRSNGRTVG